VRVVEAAALNDIVVTEKWLRDMYSILSDGTTCTFPRFNKVRELAQFPYNYFSLLNAVILRRTTTDNQ
jgi:hypothetical protein